MITESHTLNLLHEGIILMKKFVVAAVIASVLALGASLSATFVPAKAPAVCVGLACVDNPADLGGGG